MTELHHYGVVVTMLRLIFDTTSSSRHAEAGREHQTHLLRAIGDGQARMLSSVPLFLEYEAVLSRPKQLRAARLTRTQFGLPQLRRRPRRAGETSHPVATTTQRRRRRNGA